MLDSTSVAPPNGRTPWNSPRFDHSRRLETIAPYRRPEPTLIDGGGSRDDQKPVSRNTDASTKPGKKNIREARIHDIRLSFRPFPCSEIHRNSFVPRLLERGSNLTLCGALRPYICSRIRPLEIPLKFFARKADVESRRRRNGKKKSPSNFELLLRSLVLPLTAAHAENRLFLFSSFSLKDIVPELQYFCNESDNVLFALFLACTSKVI